MRLHARVEALQPGAAGNWSIRLAGEAEPLLFDGVILATSASVTAQLTRPWDAELADAHAEIPYAGSAIAVAIPAASRICFDSTSDRALRWAPDAAAII